MQAYHTPSSVRQQRFNCCHTRFYHTPKHTLWVFERATTPPFYHTPKLTLWVFGRPMAPLVYHTPLGPRASCTLSPGVHKILHPPHRIPHPVKIFSNPKMLSPGRVILCQLRYVTRVPPPCYCCMAHYESKRVRSPLPPPSMEVGCGGFALTRLQLVLPARHAYRYLVHLG